MPDVCLMTKTWRGGTAWVAQMIAQSIAEAGATIAFVAPKAEPVSREPRHDNLMRIVTPRELIAPSPRHRRIMASLLRIAAGMMAICRLRLSTKTFLFSIGEPLIFTLPLFLLLRFSGARIILVVHDAEPHAWSLPPVLRIVERGAHALSYRLAHMLVVLTSAVGAALCENFGLADGKIVTIPHGPFILSDVRPLTGNRRLLVFGSLRRNKSVLEVIKGVQLARQGGEDVVLVLAGEPLPQEPGYWEDCVAEIAKDPAGFDLRIGFMPDEDLPSLVADVDAFVLAYQNFHSQSGVGILAAFAGRPVIGTRAGGLEELMARGMAAAVVADEVTPETIAESIASFYDMPIDEWRRRANDGATKIAAGLRWDKIAADYLAVIRAGEPALLPA